MDHLSRWVPECLKSQVFGGSEISMVFHFFSGPRWILGLTDLTKDQDVEQIVFLASCRLITLRPNGGMLQAKHTSDCCDTEAGVTGNLDAEKMASQSFYSGIRTAHRGGRGFENPGSLPSKMPRKSRSFVTITVTYLEKWNPRNQILSPEVE